jgi:hypothetical protein
VTPEQAAQLEEGQELTLTVPVKVQVVGFHGAHVWFTVADGHENTYRFALMAAQITPAPAPEPTARLVSADERIERIRAEIEAISDEFPSSRFVFSENVRALLRGAGDRLTEVVEYLHMIEDQGDVARDDAPGR